jgi:hypothetical protein
MLYVFVGVVSEFFAKLRFVHQVFYLLCDVFWSALFTIMPLTLSSIISDVPTSRAREGEKSSLF